MRQLEAPVLLLVVLIAFVLQVVSAGVTQSFHKRSPTPALSVNHPKLKRKADAGPYTPEQVRLVASWSKLVVAALAGHTFLPSYLMLLNVYLTSYNLIDCLVSVDSCFICWSRSRDCVMGDMASRGRGRPGYGSE